jgi:Bifunctional DNA primase/polymerase, N-terminal
MSFFSDIALPLAQRGFRVFPLIPRTKRPLRMVGKYDHFDVASTDPAQIQAWAKQEPCANVGISPDEIFCFLETDDEAALKAACTDLGSEVWDTTRVSARDNRCYYIFRQTTRTWRAGNMTASRRDQGLDNLFEFKQHRMYVTGPGSIHPKTGQPYAVEWKPIPPLHDVLLERLCLIYGEPKPGNPSEMSEETRQQTELLDRFLSTYEVATTGDWFSKGKQWYRPIECPWLDDHENHNQGTSTCVVYTEGGGYGFDCKHRCSSKGWKDLRSELERRHPDRRFSFVGDAPSAEITLGGGSTTRLEPATLVERKRPVYHIDAWEGTVVGEFAKLCADDNNIPRKMYAEAFRCVLGAIVGDRISCPGVEGAFPRTYTVIVAPKGKGKGTAIRRAAKFFSQPWYGTRPTPGLTIQGDASGLLSGCRDFVWKPKGIGAWESTASSVPGMARLTKDLDSTIKNKPHLTWGDTLPRVISVHEEMKTFLSTLFIEGGVGSGMEGVVCQLWDDVTFHGSATGTREAVYGEMMFSLLAGITEQDWFDLLSRGNAVGSGLMSRLNLIGTEGEFENVGRMRPPDFSGLQETFLSRVVRLEDARARIIPTEAADTIITEWTDNLPEGSERMNVHAWRSAVLLAWLRHEESITAKIAQDAVRLGDYQVASHDYYRPKSADTALARVQAKILRQLEMRGHLRKRDLQRRTHAERDGTELWDRALAGLLRDKSIGQQEDGAYYRAE